MTDSQYCVTVGGVSMVRCRMGGAGWQTGESSLVRGNVSDVHVCLMHLLQAPLSSSLSCPVREMPEVYTCSGDVCLEPDDDTVTPSSQLEQQTVT